MMRLSTERDKEQFLRIIEDIKTHLVIVEGKKDVKALKSLGIENIIAMNGRSPGEIAEKLYKDKKHLNFKESSVVILTDFDYQGRRIASKFKVLFQKYHIKSNSRLRDNIMKFGKTKIEDFKEIKWTD